MKILWFTWKDRTHPLAGGAEHVNELLAKRLAKDGHEVILIVSGYKNSKTEEVINGYKVIRVGNLYTVYFHAALYYLNILRNWPDLIIEEINTIPFMTQWYASQKRVLVIYQLCRKVWFYQLFFPLNIIGFFVEPIILYILRNNIVLTESESTKNDLQNFGFEERDIRIFPISIEIPPLNTLHDKKTAHSFTILSLGAIRTMKQTLDQIKAFELAKKDIPELKMKVAGHAIKAYGTQVLEYIKNSEYAESIEYLGAVSRDKKIELMNEAHLILVTSVKEGWGLIVTEAGSQGTPAIVYNVDGLRDSVIDSVSGIICEENTLECLANNIKRLYEDRNFYHTLQQNTLEQSKTYTEDRSYETFIKELN